MVDDKPINIDQNLWGHFRGDLAEIARHGRDQFNMLLKHGATLAEDAKNDALNTYRKARDLFHTLNEDLQRGRLKPNRFMEDVKRIGEIVEADLMSIANEKARQAGSLILQASLDMLTKIGQIALGALGIA